ncbi:TIGR03809 family protein [Bradyrhizobium cosmicum]|uniref:TIGR03809 family protein n=1 Tax=Bradyrhizobium cosmicum TaxID=1404864 RepID=UPI00116252E4|nr:TIGR03809 family protein [Bradyrhizobium cosmicum]QDP25014.1 TIGR03809 family protein [Bradyrhizobium cosmicum]
MTHRQGAAVSRDVAARWCALAEQRLEHLSEMFETGRWRRYHSEISFLENIQEAKRAVQAWRALVTGDDVAAAAARVTPAFGWSPAAMPRIAPREQPAQTMQPKAVHIAPETAVPVRLDPRPDVLAEITEAPLVPTTPLAAPAAVALFTAPDAVAPLRAPAARAPLTAPVVRPPVAAHAAIAPSTAPAVKPPPTRPAAMATLLPQFAPPAAEIVTASERVVEFTFSLDGLEAKYPLLRNAF